MANKLCLTFIHVLLSFAVFSQMSDSLSNYYYYINQAELMIVDNNLIAAENKYEKAAEFKTDWYGRDYYNLALLKLKLNQPKEMMLVLEKLVRKGFDVNLLLEKEDFRNYFSTKKRIKGFNQLKIIEPTYNGNLKATYDSLYVEDSIAHELFNPEVFSHIIGKVDSSNIELIMSLIDLYGFPSESLVGIKGWFELDPIITLLSHHTEHPQFEETLDFKELILESGKRGLIKNYSVRTFRTATFTSYSYGFDGEIVKWKIREPSDSTSEKATYSDSLFTYFYRENTDSYNQIRLSKGLPTVEETFKLSKFNWEVQTDFIIGREEKEEYEVEDIKIIELITRDVKVIEIAPYSNN